MDFCLKDEWKALNVPGEVSASVKTIPSASTNDYLRNSAPSLFHVIRVSFGTWSHKSPLPPFSLYALMSVSVSTIVSVIKHDFLVHAFYVRMQLVGQYCLVL
jgi:hypothetical protein